MRDDLKRINPQELVARASCPYARSLSPVATPPGRYPATVRRAQKAAHHEADCAARCSDAVHPQRRLRSLPYIGQHRHPTCAIGTAFSRTLARAEYTENILTTAKKWHGYCYYERAVGWDCRWNRARCCPAGHVRAVGMEITLSRPRAYGRCGHGDFSGLLLRKARWAFL